MTYPDMFQELKPPRAKRRVLMHFVDVGCTGDETIARFECGKCGHESDWLYFTCDSDVKRGIPCPQCNPDFAEGSNTHE